MRRFIKWMGYVVIGTLVILGVRLLIGIWYERDLSVITANEEKLKEEALRIHSDAILFDGHNDLPIWVSDFGFDIGMDGYESRDRSAIWWIMGPFQWLPFPPFGENVQTQTDIKRIRQGGLDSQFFAIWVECKYMNPSMPIQPKQRALNIINSFKKQIVKHPEAVELAYLSDDITRIVSQKKLAAFLSLEGGHAIENDLNNLKLFYDLGIRYMTLTYTCSLDWADSANDEPKANGLSEFGRKVIWEMNRLGIIVDISHVSEKTVWDTLSTSKAPIIASHSSVSAIKKDPRNLTDELIQAIADKNGVVMINFFTPFIDPDRASHWKSAFGWYWFFHPSGHKTPLSLLIDHIDHAVKIAGIDHVGLGSDFGTTIFLPEGLKHVGDFPKITVELFRRGYTEEEIRKILGGNIIRVMTEVETIAKRLADEKPE